VMKEGYSLHYSEYTTIGEREENEDAFCADLVYGFSSKKVQTNVEEKRLGY